MDQPLICGGGLRCFRLPCERIACELGVSSAVSSTETSSKLSTPARHQSFPSDLMQLVDFARVQRQGGGQDQP